ncbi:hypothetical protein BESB_010360 [Besnoitia besnoiti]|uniref:Serine aminopeptidase S33 domain-containing protein n=1 Tax=Besnoitia besnoiti TaxID=94643 RepID=A0A2A9MMT5_BESBE|nr:hypothetical protein BESB_010360 [Besnoitia besnoiti]PFH38694.1 hypothetical protein BESB_010360 [Besnoitia besnoiti]
MAREEAQRESSPFLNRLSSFASSSPFPTSAPPGPCPEASALARGRRGRRHSDAGEGGGEARRDAEREREGSGREWSDAPDSRGGSRRRRRAMRDDWAPERLPAAAWARAVEAREIALRPDELVHTTSPFLQLLPHRCASRVFAAEAFCESGTFYSFGERKKGTRLQGDLLSFQEPSALRIAIRARRRRNAEGDDARASPTEDGESLGSSGGSEAREVRRLAPLLLLSQPSSLPPHAPPLPSFLRGHRPKETTGARSPTAAVLTPPERNADFPSSSASRRLRSPSCLSPFLHFPRRPSPHRASFSASTVSEVAASAACRPSSPSLRPASPSSLAAPSVPPLVVGGPSSRAASSRKAERKKKHALFALFSNFALATHPFGDSVAGGVLACLLRHCPGRGESFARALWVEEISTELLACYLSAPHHPPACACASPTCCGVRTLDADDDRAAGEVDAGCKVRAEWRPAAAQVGEQSDEAGRQNEGLGGRHAGQPGKNEDDAAPRPAIPSFSATSFLHTFLLSKRRIHFSRSGSAWEGASRRDASPQPQPRTPGMSTSAVSTGERPAARASERREETHAERKALDASSPARASPCRTEKIKQGSASNAAVGVYGAKLDEPERRKSPAEEGEAGCSRRLRRGGNLMGAESQPPNEKSVERTPRNSAGCGALACHLHLKHSHAPAQERIYYSKTARGPLHLRSARVSLPPACRRRLSSLRSRPRLSSRRGPEGSEATGSEATSSEATGSASSLRQAGTAAGLEHIEGASQPQLLPGRCISLCAFCSLDVDSGNGPEDVVVIHGICMSGSFFSDVISCFADGAEEASPASGASSASPEATAREESESKATACQASAHALRPPPSFPRAGGSVSLSSEAAPPQASRSRLSRWRAPQAREGSASPSSPSSSFSSSLSSYSSSPTAFAARRRERTGSGDVKPPQGRVREREERESERRAEEAARQREARSRGSATAKAQLDASCFTFYNVDLVGFGRSTSIYSPTDYSRIEQAQRVIQDVIVANKLAAVHLVGHSFGGLVAAEVARMLPPGAVKSVLLLAPAYFESTRQAMQILTAIHFPASHSIAHPIVAYFILKVGRLLRPVLEPIFHFVVPKDELPQLSVADLFIIDPAAMMGTIRSIVNERLEETLQMLQDRRIRVTIVHGTGDGVIPIRQSQVIAERYSNVQLRPVKGFVHHFPSSHSRFTAHLIHQEVLRYREASAVKTSMRPQSVAAALGSAAEPADALGARLALGWGLACSEYL